MDHKKPRPGLTSRIRRKRKMIAEYERLAQLLATHAEKAAYFRKRAEDFRAELRKLEAE